MTLKPLGDSAWMVEFPELSSEAVFARVMGLVQALASHRPASVLDVVSSFESVAVHFQDVGGEEVRSWIESMTIADQLPSGREIEIPVCYGGENGADLDEVAARTGLAKDDVITLHAATTYTVAAVGFSPGFPYLAGLPQPLHLPRLATPRLAVPAGSVAIAGAQTGIYPFASPGGWHLLGRTALPLFDPQATPPALLQPGDRVRFIPVGRLEPASPPATFSRPTPPGNRLIEVISPGALTTVQDLGRFGHEASGVSPGGVADRHAMRVANLLVGNDENAAVLEFCVSGPILKFHSNAVIAWVAAGGKPRHVATGETVDFSRLPGSVRACLAIAGGLRVTEVLGSAATDLRGGFGGFQGRALQTGDLLAIGPEPKIPRGTDWHVGHPAIGKAAEIELRFLRGVQDDWFSEDARQRFRQEIYQLTPRADRTGARLAGSPLGLLEPREMISQPVACGSVQVPPDGQPIILLAARQTIGGYPQIGHVISVDLPLLARAWPGTAVRFREITPEQARSLKQSEKRDFDWLRTGLDLLKSGPCG